MVKIKICGITRLQDALDASLAGADCLGFNFSKRSPRVITEDNAKAIIAKLPPFVQSAGIFVDHSPEVINEICRFCNLQIAQLHSEQYTPEDARTVTSAHVIRVFRPEETFDSECVRSYARESGTNTFLFDAYRPGMEGGTGERIGASLASRIFSELGTACYSILAGGLNESNVAEAIRLTRPYAVDTASGVECEPGIKDQKKVTAFIQAVRSAYELL
ncbi:MAG: phosphoribosylanthranilate isomerase [Chlorobiaceae bacterium]|nr:phosphoribosylanthranilate isomerase [Chlorobiaceae bacterium]